MQELKFSCPQCKAVLRLKVSAQTGSTKKITCPKCSKAFQIRLTPATAGSPIAPPVAPIAQKASPTYPPTVQPESTPADDPWAHFSTPTGYTPSPYSIGRTVSARPKRKIGLWIGLAAGLLVLLGFAGGLAAWMILRTKSTEVAVSNAANEVNTSNEENTAIDDANRDSTATPEETETPVKKINDNVLGITAFVPHSGRNESTDEIMAQWLNARKELFEVALKTPEFERIDANTKHISIQKFEPMLLDLVHKAMDVPPKSCSLNQFAGFRDKTIKQLRASFDGIDETGKMDSFLLLGGGSQSSPWYESARNLVKADNAIFSALCLHQQLPEPSQNNSENWTPAVRRALKIEFLKIELGREIAKKVSALMRSGQVGDSELKECFEEIDKWIKETQNLAKTPMENEDLVVKGLAHNYSVQNKFAFDTLDSLANFSSDPKLWELIEFAKAIRMAMNDAQFSKWDELNRFAEQSTWVLYSESRRKKEKAITTNPKLKEEEDRFKNQQNFIQEMQKRGPGAFSREQLQDLQKGIIPKVPESKNEKGIFSSLDDLALNPKRVKLFVRNSNQKIANEIKQTIVAEGNHQYSLMSSQGSTIVVIRDPRCEIDEFAKKFPSLTVEKIDEETRTIEATFNGQ